jgi:primosomal protein N' (replication factor Y) (superfamily II helicase)
MMLFADVILPVPLHSLFTYSVPEALRQNIYPGSRVYVPFGRNKRYTGIVFRVHSVKPIEYEVKDIEQLLEISPSVLPSQLKLMNWISEYYLCAIGDVMKALLPSGMRPDKEEERDGYKPKTEVFVKLNENINVDSVNDIIIGLKKRCAKQAEALECFMNISGLREESEFQKPISKRNLQEKCSSATAIAALESKSILSFYKVEVGRVPRFSEKLIPPASLNDAQQKAMKEIKECFKTKNVCLLHGVTSCGKTEIYIHLIKEQLEKGNQVLYLLPEIALTTQIMWRLQRVFGDSMCVYHSRCSDDVRVEIWNKQIGDAPYGLVLGARSAVMLPFKKLGLVIVDEEHETNFKQESPAPRYNARNTAIMLALYGKAKVLLGSATPALESYCNAIQGKYCLVTISERYLDLPTPEIEVVDIAEMRRKKYMNGLFSPQLINHITDALSAKEQVILFHNRRGYISIVECDQCGWIQKCSHCDVSLTYHKSNNASICHYCGRSYSIPKVCPKCGARAFHGMGFGTERIEEMVNILFPQARVARLDIDSVSTKGRYEEILEDFQNGRTDILIGTQMVSKGLDFNNVSVVGILQADQMLNFPDFRAEERAYQLMTQVSGRSGRRHRRGLVVIQTKDPAQDVLTKMTGGDFKSFFTSQMIERKSFFYPPYSRLTAVWLKGRDEKILDEAAELLANHLINLFGTQMVLGPDAPTVARVQSLYMRKLLIKTRLSTSFVEINESLLRTAKMVENDVRYHGINIFFDVDPV